VRTIPLREFQREGVKALGAGFSAEPRLLTGRDREFVLPQVPPDDRTAALTLRRVSRRSWSCARIRRALSRPVWIRPPWKTSRPRFAQPERASGSGSAPHESSRRPGYQHPCLGGCESRQRHRTDP